MPEKLTEQEGQPSVSQKIIDAVKAGLGASKIAQKMDVTKRPGQAEQLAQLDK